MYSLMIFAFSQDKICTLEKLGALQKFRTLEHKFSRPVFYSMLWMTPEIMSIKLDENQITWVTGCLFIYLFFIYLNLYLPLV